MKGKTIKGPNLSCDQEEAINNKHKEDEKDPTVKVKYPKHVPDGEEFAGSSCYPVRGAITKVMRAFYHSRPGLAAQKVGQSYVSFIVSYLGKNL